jgi:cytidylate kinase
MAENIGRKVIVIEGTGGAGKTTTAQVLAARYGLNNFNTGTLFRATAATMLHEGITLFEAADFVEQADYLIENDLNGLYVAVDGLDVSDVLQLPEVTNVSSRIGQIGSAALRLETIFNSNLSSGRDMVVEGKHLADRIGAAATQLFFFDAQIRIRAHRKWKQAQLNGRVDYTLAEALIDMRTNDLRDKKLLVMPRNTEIVDTSYLTPLEVAQRVAQRSSLN